MSLPVDRERALEVADRLHALGSVSVTSFFGGAGIRLDGIQFAFLIKGVLYFRVNERSRLDYESLGSAPFRYVGHKKQVTVLSYYQVPDEIVDDPDNICSWAAKACEAAATANSTPRRQSVRPRRAVRR